LATLTEKLKRLKGALSGATVDLLTIDAEVVLAVDALRLMLIGRLRVS